MLTYLPVFLNKSTVAIHRFIRVRSSIGGLCERHEVGAFGLLGGQRAQFLA